VRFDWKRIEEELRALLPGKAAAISLEHQRSEAEEEVLKQIAKALGADEESRTPTK
jgi:hypothetical protein